MCWYHEKKKNPSNTKIVQRASEYAQRKQTAQLISTQNKPKRPVYLGLSHTHMQENWGSAIIQWFHWVKEDERGKIIHPGAAWSERRYLPPWLPTQIHMYIRGLHTILSMRLVGPGVWPLLLKPVIDQKPFCASNTRSLHHWSLAMGLPSATLSL